ncbi:MAG TPA: hypothetical protein VFV38_03925 [Ktedonobacteraceae bacterium]|nr:hypothetical protein [Ktedonobacteraceae bacterium]
MSDLQSYPSPEEVRDYSSTSITETHAEKTGFHKSTRRSRRRRIETMQFILIVAVVGLVVYSIVAKNDATLTAVLSILGAIVSYVFQLPKNGV